MEKIEFIGSPNYRPRLEDRKISTLILHYTYDDYESTIGLFTKEDGLSVHYVVREDGKIIQMVDEENIAYHAGESYWRGEEALNNTSVGIEIVNTGNKPYPQEQIDSVIKLSKDIISRYDDITPFNILGHSDIATLRRDISRLKFDPGPLLPWDYLSKNGIGAPIISDDVDNTSHKVLLGYGDKGDEVLSLQHKFLDYGYYSDLSGVYDRIMAQSVEAFKVHFCSHLGLGLYASRWSEIYPELVSG